MSRLRALIGLLSLVTVLAVLPGDGTPAPSCCPGASPNGVTLWPNNAAVPYAIGPLFSNNQAQTIRLAVAEWGAVSGLNLVEVTPFQIQFIANGINFVAVTNAAAVALTCGAGAGGCSQVGMQGGVQAINLASFGNLNRFLVAHEVGHALGLMHEHQRSDAGTFITPNQANYTGAQWANDFGIDFGSQNWSVYDYDSIMHYPANAFATIGTNTLTQNINAGLPCSLNIPAGPAGQGYCPATAQIGQVAHLSIGDAVSLAAMYGAPPAPTLTAVQDPTATGELFTPPDDIAPAPFQNWTVTLNGSRLFAGSTDNAGIFGTQVFFDATQLTTNLTVTSASTMTVTIPGALLSPGEHTIFVRNVLPVGGGDSEKLTVTVPCGETNTPSTWTGNLNGEYFGSAIVSMGDLDGDTIIDYGVGAPGYASRRGRVQVISGATGDILYERVGLDPGDEYGACLAAADVDGDGDLDILYGAPGANDTGIVIARAVTGWQADSFWNLGSAGGSDQPGAKFGSSLAVSSNGEVVIGAPGAAEVWLYTLDLTPVGNITNPVGGNSRFGASVSFCGDLDDDGDTDFVVGAPTANGEGLATVYRWDASPTALFDLDGPGGFSLFGYSVAGVGDTNLDGYEDILVGIPVGADFKGIARLVSGKTGGVLFDIVGEKELDWAGLCVAGAGDFDQDGRADFIVSSPNADFKGRVEVFSGRDGSSLWRRSGTAHAGFFGLAVCAPGDINGDGLPDIVVGAPYAEPPTCMDVFTGTVQQFAGLGPMAQHKLMITEAAWGTQAGVEIANFDTVPHDLVDWTLMWRFTDAAGAQTLVSDPLDQALDPGQVMVVTALGLGDVGVPVGALQLERFSSPLPGGDGTLEVALISPTGAVADELRIVPPIQTFPPTGLGGLFRGPVARTSLTAGADGGIERIWGLDTNGPEDWTEQPLHSLGWESRSSGPRGFDALFPPRPAVRITEIDPRNPNYVEIHNVGTNDVDLTNWCIRTSRDQGVAHATVRPFPNGFVLPASERVVIGDGSAPDELPNAVSYLLADTGFQWSAGPFDCALYDHLGRVIDLVRTTGYGNKVVHNHPRAPSYWQDFVGAAGRDPIKRSVRGHVVGRTGMGDSNTGGDWAPLKLRTMGSPNAGADGPVGHLMALDVRVHSLPNTGGFELIAIAPAAYAGATFYMAASPGHDGGLGPLFGMPLDALDWLWGPGMNLPWTGQFDAQASFRIGFPGDALPLGMSADILAIALPQGMPFLLTRVLEYDAF